MVTAYLTTKLIKVRENYIVYIKIIIMLLDRHYAAHTGGQINVNCSCSKHACVIDDNI